MAPYGWWFINYIFTLAYYHRIYNVKKMLKYCIKLRNKFAYHDYNACVIDFSGLIWDDSICLRYVYLIRTYLKQIKDSPPINPGKLITYNCCSGKQP